MMNKHAIEALLRANVEGTEIGEETLKRIVQQILIDDPYLRLRIREAQADDALNITVNITMPITLSFARSVLKEMTDDKDA